MTLSAQLSPASSLLCGAFSLSSGAVSILFGIMEGLATFRPIFPSALLNVSGEARFVGLTPMHRFGVGLFWLRRVGFTGVGVVEFMRTGMYDCFVATKGGVLGL